MVWTNFSSNLIERVASFIHWCWSRWMQYIFDEGHWLKDGGYYIPADKVIRWKRQMGLKYEDLPGDEQMSDRQLAGYLLAELAKMPRFAGVEFGPITEAPAPDGGE